MRGVRAREEGGRRATGRNGRRREGGERRKGETYRIRTLQLLVARLTTQHQPRLLCRNRTRVRERTSRLVAIDAVLADRLLLRLTRKLDGRGCWLRLLLLLLRPSASERRVERRRVRVEPTRGGCRSAKTVPAAVEGRSGSVPDTLHRREGLSLRDSVRLGLLHHERGEVLREGVGDERREGDVGEDGGVGAGEDRLNGLGDLQRRRRWGAFSPRPLRKGEGKRKGRTASKAGCGIPVVLTGPAFRPGAN